MKIRSEGAGLFCADERMDR